MDRNIVLFLNAIGISNRNIQKILKLFNSYKDFKSNYKLLYELDNIDKRTVKKIINNIDFNISDYIKRIKKLNVNIVFYDDDNYPKNLRFIDDYPLILYYRGTLLEDDYLGVSIVGARKCTSYGSWACSKIAKELSYYNIPIISGLAYGIDKIAHETALQNNNRTIAVLGNGIDIIYPKNNYKVYNEILKNGAIITEYPLGTQPLGYNFPYRNRIISGIGQGVVVIEAMEKSGTLITANYAAEQGKEVFALPGNINSLYSKGTNLLIKDGAKILISIDDILEEIEYRDVKKDSINIQFSNDEEKIIYNELLKEPKTANELSITTNIKIDNINVVLTILELNGYIIELKGGKFSTV
ncbi:DNA-processing protein DprA [Miniphocaeibacter halophilus]|uniref:DNA-protecting protein DprA n=1 Tax=Miniphocaeibacter halophilus TaxID=2931922 RepID=A0AC61MQ13_9FIRM|nr:DNA-processing protein DprA [Miniphocaeibacter halophilus]QQK07687.1 DNA-protecting protein DprA [Miniphocaeibacter halophilus]